MPSLQKMFLLTEPAFKKYKQEQDNEKFMNNMDKDMKRILYDKKAPLYRKWLEYSRLLHRYLDFKKFLDDSNGANDAEAVEKFVQMENRMKNSSTNTTPRKTSNVSTHMSPLKSIISPANEPKQLFAESHHDSDISIGKEDLFENTSAESFQSTPDPTAFYTTAPQEKLRERLNDTILPFEKLNASYATSSLMSASKAAKAARIQKKQEKSLQNISHLDDSGEIERHYDNTIIAKQTLRQRLDALPPKVQAKFFINGKYPTRLFSIDYIDTKTEIEHILDVNGWDASIVSNKNLRVYEPDHGFVTYHDIQPYSLATLRQFLVNKHREIDEALESYNNSSNPTAIVARKKYSVSNLENDKDSKIIRYKKDTFVTVPSVILDQVIEAINKVNLTSDEFKSVVKQMKAEYKSAQAQNQNQTTIPTPTVNANKSVLHPLNQTAATSYTVDNLSTFGKLPPQSQSTPVRRKRAAVAVIKKRSTLSGVNKKTITPQMKALKRKALQPQIDKIWRQAKKVKTVSQEEDADTTANGNSTIVWEKI